MKFNWPFLAGCLSLMIARYFSESMHRAHHVVVCADIHSNTIIIPQPERAMLALKSGALYRSRSPHSEGSSGCVKKGGTQWGVCHAVCSPQLQGWVPACEEE